MNEIIILLSFYGLTWTIQNAELFAWPRNWLMRRSVFFFKLLSCSFCTGFHSGWIIFLLSRQPWSLPFIFLWGLAGAAVSFILTGLMNRLSTGTL